jgi:hypothetical protein
MPNAEETKVRDLVTRTTEVLKRASAGPDDIGSRYSRLLELLWRSKEATISSPAGTQQSSDFQVPSSAIAHRLPEQNNYMQFSPANDFSWLDLEAVGDYVSGDQLPGTNTLALDSFQTPDPYQTGQDRSQSWQQNWPGDMTNLLF